MAGILPWIIVAVVLLVVFRMVVGAVKTSAKMMMWLVIAIALGAGFLWYQQNGSGSTTPNLPSLSIPSGGSSAY